MKMRYRVHYRIAYSIKGNLDFLTLQLSFHRFCKSRTFSSFTFASRSLQIKYIESLILMIDLKKKKEENSPNILVFRNQKREPFPTDISIDIQW